MHMSQVQQGTIGRSSRSTPNLPVIHEQHPNHPLYPNHLSTLKSFTCASCAEHVRDAKPSNIPITNTNLDILHHPTLIAPDIGCNGPPMPFTDGPLGGIFIDSTGVSCDGNNMTCLALFPS